MAAFFNEKTPIYTFVKYLYADVFVVYIGSLTAGLKSAAPGENLQPSKFFKTNLNVHLDVN